MVEALHEGQFEQPLWSTFLERLRRRAQADYASLLIRRAEAPFNELIELFARAPGDPGRLRFETIYLLDPQRYHALRPGRVYDLQDLREPPAAPQNAGNPELGEFQHAQLMRVAEPGGCTAWVVIARRARPFGAAEGALLSSLARHIGLAVRAFVAVERERYRSEVAQHALHRLNFGWMSLAADGQLIDFDVNAERMLQRSQVLRRTSRGRLMLASPEADRALGKALRTFEANPLARPQAIHLSDEPWIDILVLSTADRAMPANRTRAPMTIIYIHGDEQTSTHRVEQIVDLFGLSRNEARLALALSRGRSIAEAAEEIGISLETARSYSKNVYAKTGTRRQADLVRLILISVITLA
ncbi:hypothetical protein GCM10010909_13250 [Acidocella aquatica]|uniref:HTH luxR-type domain-containing protein n=2 Tax=Acidocella aquatica TaxID=1922313 RepID=A0ABQ6A5Q8_9PROT|nr:hypothetical protein GCM10010909_13250 [Acidocella aquatica]